MQQYKLKLFSFNHLAIYNSSPKLQCQFLLGNNLDIIPKIIVDNNIAP